MNGKSNIITFYQLKWKAKRNSLIDKLSLTRLTFDEIAFKQLVLAMYLDLQSFHANDVIISYNMPFMLKLLDVADNCFIFVFSRGSSGILGK